jgi:hypothetical protein
MSSLSPVLIVYVTNAFIFQILLCAHFAIRKRRQSFAIRWGWVVYALGIPAALMSVAILVAGYPWYYWLAGFLYLAWGAYGYSLEYLWGNQSWRSPFQWKVGGPYLSLYLAAVMLYWWPLSLIYKPFWYIYLSLFLLGTLLNVTSHNPQKASR